MKNSKKPQVFFNPPPAHSNQNNSFVHESGNEFGFGEGSRDQRKKSKQGGIQLKNLHQAQKQQKEFERMFQDPFGDEEGFQQSVIDHNVDDDLIDNFGSQMLIMGDDLNKMHQNFAGDTFSQISSTYEQQQNPLPHPQGQSNLGNDKSAKNSKLHSYQEKKVSKGNGCDELLDSAILDRLGNDELNSPKDDQESHRHFMLGKGNQIIDFQFLQHQPSAHSNNLGLMMDNLQQSDMQSSVTVYNSGIFDDASIMRILDKSISDESLFLYNQPESNPTSGQQQSQMRSGIEMEQSFKFECEDVKQILVNVSSKLKEKLQKQRSVHAQSQSQLIAISVEELKQFEILSSSAIEKIRQIQMLGKQLLEAQRVKALSLKNYKQNLKIHLHTQISKYRDAFHKQIKHAERKKIKYQINEYDLNEKVRGLEERFGRQSEEINKLANKCEQLKYDKQHIQQKYEAKLSHVDQVLQSLMKLMPDSAKQTNLHQNKKNASKVNNSFCLGCDHSMLLQPSKKRPRQDLQQSVDEDKENSSILSNTKLNHDQIEIRAYLNQMQHIIQEKVTLNPRVNLQPQQEGGSYFETSSMYNLIGELDIKRDSLIQQSQFVPAESQADVNQAFIQSQQESSVASSSQYPPGDKKFINLLDDVDDEGNNQSVEYKFNEDHILVMDGNRQKNQMLFSHGPNDAQFLDEKISTQDLAPGRLGGQVNITDTQRLAQDRQQRQKLLGNGQFNFFNQSSMANSEENELNNFLNEEKKEEAFFPVNLSGIDNSLLGRDGGHQGSVGAQNIFIADEFTGGSLDFNSRNGDVLYSGGSSQLSMMQAFYQRPKPQNNEMIVIKVQDRRISIPKLDLKVIQEHCEPYKGNLQVTNFNDDSSILTESQMPESSKTHAQQMLNQHTDLNNHINSFQNDSLSKQFQSKFESIEDGGPQSMLDKAICIDNSKAGYSISSSKEGASGKVTVPFNMFDSFKQELGMLEQSSKKPDNSQTKSKPPAQITLDLEDDEELQSHPHHDQKQVKDEDKSIDLSLNISRFKKSLSDPNLMFNDVHSDDEDHQANDQNVRDCNDQPQVKKTDSSQIQQIIAFKKLKTPQAQQNKLKFSMPKAETNEAPQFAIQEKRKSLGQFQAKIRSSSGNSRQGKEGSTDSAAIQSQKLKSMIKIQKLQVKGVKPSIGNLTVLESSETDQTVLVPCQIGQQSFVNKTRIESPDKQQHFEDEAASRIIKKILRKPILPKKEEEDKRQGSQSEAPSQIGKPQLIQNYMSSAAAMSGSTSQVKKGQFKLSKGSLVGRNSMIVSETGNSSQQEVNLSQMQPQASIQAKITGSMMHEMKVYQESQDLTLGHGVIRQVRQKQGNKEESKDTMLCLSPGKTPQRSSQSCTPQKKGKSIIVLSKQLIKQVPRKLNINSQNSNDQSHLDQQNHSVMTKPSNTISLKKISIIKTTNQTAINHSIDQSHLFSSNHHPDESSVMPDSSLFINDISVINPRIPTKPKQQLVKPLTEPDTSVSQTANKNLKNILQSNMDQIKTAGTHLTNKQGLMQKLMLQKQIAANYSSAQSSMQDKQGEMLSQDKAYQSNQQPLAPPTSKPQEDFTANSRMQKRRRELLNRANNNLQNM